MAWNPFKKKPSTVAISSESSEGESGVAVEEKPKNSGDLFQEYPQRFESELQYESESTKKKVEEFINGLKKSETLSVLTFRRRSEKNSQDQDQRVNEFGFDKRDTEVLDRILGTEINPVVSRRARVPSPKIDRRNLVGANIQNLELEVYPTKYDDLFSVHTRNDFFDSTRGGFRQEEKRFVVKMSAEDVDVLREGKPGDYKLGEKLSRFDSTLASDFHKAKET